MNWHHKGSKVLIAGQSGSGKTTKFLDMFKTNGAKYKFAFDPDLEISRKIGIAPCKNVESMMRILTNCILGKTKTSVIVFDPADLFPADFGGGLSFFCRWTIDVSKTLHGKKLLAIDEIQKFTRTGNGGVPYALIEICDTGRREELDLLAVCNKGINELNDDIRAQMTELFCFKTTTTNAQKILSAEMNFSTEEIETVTKLPKGGFIHKKL